MATALTRSPAVRPLRARSRSCARSVVLVAATAMAVLVAAAMSRRYYVDPFSTAGQYAPLAAGLAVAVAVAVVDRVRGGEAAARVGVVLVPAWIAFFTAGQLSGTPYDFGGVRADIGRLSALATRFTVSTASSDQFVTHLPSEYPPLFPWLVGKAAVVTGVPAWRLLSAASVVTVALSAAASYALWRRVAGPALALALCLVPAAVYGDPRKAYEVLAASVLLPWVVATFGRSAGGRPRLHWLPAGVIGGLMVATYQAYLVFAAAGIVVLAAVGMARRPRLAYARHVVLTAATALVVAAWYLVPWLVAKVRDGGTNLADRYHGPMLANDPLHLPWQHPMPVAIALLAGLALLVGYARTDVRARCLLAVALSTMVYRWLNLWRYHVTGHTGFLVKTGRLSDAALIAGLVCGMALLAPAVRRRLGERPAGRLIPYLRAVAVGGVLAVCMATFWQAQRVGAPESPSAPNFAQMAHGTQLPGGAYPRYAWHTPREFSVLPVKRIRRIVESVYGADALPVTLSYSEAISAYYPYFQYVGTGASSSNSLSAWPQRRAEVSALSLVDDPREFAARSARLRNGQIDVFVLRRRGGRLFWGFEIAFSRQQFAARYFVHVALPDGTDVFVRRGASVRHASYPD